MEHRNPPADHHSLLVEVEDLVVDVHSSLVVVAVCCIVAVLRTVAEVVGHTEEDHLHTGLTVVLHILADPEEGARCLFHPGYRSWSRCYQAAA